MMSLKDLQVTDLLWIQPERKSRLYELRAGDASVLRLRWENKRGARATAESEAGTWEIDKQGALRPRVLIKAVGSSIDLATYRGGWNGRGTLEFRDGRRYTWNNANFLRTAWIWTNRQDQTLLQFKGKTMRIDPAGRTMPEISLLAALSWYLKIMNNQANSDGAIAAMVATGI